MTQTIKQRITLREVMDELRAIRGMLEPPAATFDALDRRAKFEGLANFRVGTPIPLSPFPLMADGTIDITRISLPTDVIAPAPPPVASSGAALGRARFFLKLWHSITDLPYFFTRKPRRSETGSRDAVSFREAP